MPTSPLIISGKWGNVDNMYNVRNWNITQTSTPKAYVHSGTNKATGRRPGTKDWSGSFATYGGSAIIAALQRVGTLFNFGGYTAPTNGISGDGRKYTGSALSTQAAVAWNWETNDLVQCTENFGGNGVLTNNAAATTTEIGDPTNTMETSATGGIALGDANSSYDLICGIKSATFNLLVPERTFVDSCTNGWTGRRAGAGLDANLSLVLNGTGAENDLGIVSGQNCEMSLFITDEIYIWVNALKYREMSGLTVDRETGNIIGYTANFDLDIDFTSSAGINPPGIEIRLVGSGSPMYTLWSPL